MPDFADVKFKVKARQIFLPDAAEEIFYGAHIGRSLSRGWQKVAQCSTRWHNLAQVGRRWHKVVEGGRSLSRGWKRVEEV